MENTEIRCAAGSRADRRKHWGLGDRQRGTRNRDRALSLCGPWVPRFPDSRTPLADLESASSSKAAQMTLSCQRALHRPAQLLGSRGPLRHGPDANAVVGGGDAGQRLTETPHLMGLQAALEHAPLQPFAIALQQFSQLLAALVAGAVVGDHPQLLLAHRRRGMRSGRSGSYTASAKLFTS